jgi:PAS domain S-box-containing protein
LTLAEFLLTTEDLTEISQMSLDWLSRHAGVPRSLCLVPPDDYAASLVTIASHGIAPTSATFTLNLDETEHPLVKAWTGGQPVTLPPPEDPRQSPLTPIGHGAVHALPLVGPEPSHRPSVGLLLLSARPGQPAELAWAARVLGHRLAHLRSRSSLAGAERRLLRERELLSTIINAVPDPILLTDTEGRMLIANGRAEALLASREGESEGRRRAVALNNMLFSSALSQRAMNDVESWRHELLLVDPTDGSDLLFELLSAVRNDPREGTGIVSILRNVTDLRRATEEIEENYQKLRLAEADVRAERDRLDLIIDSVVDPILVTDPSGNIVLMNAPAERLFTVDPRSSEEAQRVVRANDAHFSSFVSNLFFAGEGSRRSGAIGLLNPQTGDDLPVEAISGKIFSQLGEVTGVVTILHDRTEQLEKARLYEQLKRASDELEQKVREATAELVRQNELLRRQAIELEQASTLKSQFLANMSHEFRTPLNAILGYTSMLLQGVSGEMTAGQKRNLARVDSNGRHLLSIINDILDISRIEAGKMPLTVADFELPAMITEVMGEVEPLIAGSRVAVASELQHRLPRIRGDRQKVKQIVLNLLTNALKFTPQGSVRVVTVYQEETDQVAIAVADTGIGIAESDRERIFEDFRQADNSPTREYSGAGLGLSICRRLATMMDGTITLESKVGLGSTFTLVVPRRLRRR